jgi:alpha-beta hydrolase superfamily lysophospholipase
MFTFIRRLTGRLGFFCSRLHAQALRRNVRTSVLALRFENYVHTKTLASAVVMFGLTVPAAGDELPKTVAESEVMEHANILASTDFYSAPVSIATSKPGELLRKEYFTGYAVPPGTTTVRILYHSLDAQGRGVPASAVVIIPGGPVPAKGWPVIAWAHGTSGVARQCAPSLMKDLYYGDEGLAKMVLGGVAVVAVDYHGLGTAGQHQYVSKAAQARDVIYSIPAARAAVPTLGSRWVADGHSQGGLATWGVAEMETGLQDDSYLGAISVAGAAKLDDLMAYLDDTQGGTFYLAYMAFGIQAMFPAFKPEEILTPQAIQLYAQATTQGCWYYGYALFKDMPKHKTLKSNWRDNNWVREYARGNGMGAIRINKPMLILAGEADLTVPIDGVRDAVRRACMNGSSVMFKSYPGLDHDPTMVESIPDQLAWIRDRYAGKKSPDSCSAQ